MIADLIKHNSVRLLDGIFIIDNSADEALFLAETEIPNAGLIFIIKYGTVGATNYAVITNGVNTFANCPTTDKNPSRDFLSTNPSLNPTITAFTGNLGARRTNYVGTVGGTASGVPSRMDKGIGLMENIDRSGEGASLFIGKDGLTAAIQGLLGSVLSDINFLTLLPILEDATPVGFVSANRNSTILLGQLSENRILSLPAPVPLNQGYRKVLKNSNSSAFNWTSNQGIEDYLGVSLVSIPRGVTVIESTGSKWIAVSVYNS